MYKETIISIIIVVLIFTVDYITQNYTEKKVCKIEDKLGAVKQSLEEEDLKRSEEKINEVENEWNNVKDIFACYIEHNELNKVETSFTLCKSYTKLENFEQAINKLDETMFVLNNMNERYILSLQNIF